MSGLEPLVALGLACNVLQLVEVGHETINLIKTVYRGGRPDATLDQRAAILGDISDEVKACRRAKKCPKHEHQLLDAAERCYTAARDLREEIQVLVGNAKQGSLASVLKLVAKTNWRRRRLDRLKESLDSAERLMQTGLLTRIWSSTSTAELDLKDVKGGLRSFIEQSRQGNKDINKLVLRESIGIRNHVDSLSTKTNEILGRVDQRMDSLVLEAGVKVNQAERQRLLQSLKYPGFNERRNHVSEAYDNTAKWIFAGDGNDIHVPADSGPDSDDMDSEKSKSKERTQNGPYELSGLKWDSFSNWLRSTDTFYWISGKPGSGKPTLVKFILDHPDTKAFLEVWNPGTLILSHFFWRPGTSLQQNIKGLLCSLLYQLLQNSAKALSSVLSSVPGSSAKDADTDWSKAELLDLCIRVSSAYEQPLCFFLDGLDEVDPRDGVVSLLHFIDKLSQCRNTKICLSSRPEPLLQNRLSTFPRLRLQDLNRSDLKLYARGHVRFPDDYIAEHHGNPIISLIDRAEGVFLWLVLATKSINKGVEYGDTTATFQERIDRLPGDLISLYKDMWNRAREDDPLAYRQTAALYFKLLLTHHNDDLEVRYFFHDLQLLTLMLASTPTADHILQAGDEDLKLFPEDVMVQRCKEVERKVNVYCFGLIELSEIGASRTWTTGMYGNNVDALIHLTGAERVLRFIHRTAHDFLTDTIEGKEILGCDMSTKMCLGIRIIKAYLAGSRLFIHGSSFAAVPLYLIRTLRLIYNDADDWLASDWVQLIDYCEILCNTGKLFAGTRRQARLCKGEDFLKAVANTCGDERIRSAINHETLSQDSKSEILLNSCNLYADEFGYLMYRDRFVESSIKTLLTEGADPNYKGVMFSPDMWHWPFAQLKTPFTEYLETTLIQVKEKRVNSVELCVILETLHIYTSQKADFDDIVTFFFNLGYHPTKSCKEPSQNTFVPYQLVHSGWIMEEGLESVLFASFPAHNILDALLYTIRRDYSPPAEETRFEKLFLFLENECQKWYSRGACRAFGRACRDGRTSKEPVWFETTAEHQERIGTELLTQLRNLKSLSPDAGTNIGESPDSLLSLCAQAPWSKKASGENGIWARFEEMGIFTRIDGLCELRSIEEWVEGR